MELPKIGVPAAVRPSAHGTPPGGEQRILQVGLDLHADEEITTGPTGQTHLLFRDGSAISIGPNSSLRLDKFVYDPASKEGELVASVSKGLFRFVGGRISKKKAVLFKAPTATIGIRGGVAIMEINSPQQIEQAQQQGQALAPATAHMLFGDAVTMQTPEQFQTITQSGFTLTQQVGGGLAEPVRTTPQQLSQSLSGLEDPQPEPEGEGEQSPQQLGQIAPAAGGPAVSNEDVANSQVSNLNSNTAPDAGPETPGADLGLGVPSAEDVGGSEAAQQTALDATTDQVQPAGSVSPVPVGPTSDSNGAANSILESAANGAAIGVTAVAVDGNALDTVRYSLTNNAGGRFSIDPVTGVLSVASSALLDRESAAAFNVTVRATSSDGSFSEAAFTINLLDDNTEFAASATVDTDPAAGPLLDTTANGTAIGITAFATDGDATDVIGYSLSNNADGRFAVNGTSGVVTLANTALLDFTANDSYTVTVQSASTDGTSSTGNFVVRLLTDRFSGRSKRSLSNVMGTGDTVASQNLALTPRVGNDIFTDTTAFGPFNLTFPTAAGDFNVAGGTSPNGAVSGAGNFTADRHFVSYELTEDGNASNTFFLFAGIGTEIGNFPTTGITAYALEGDFAMQTELPFTGGNLGRTLTPTSKPQVYVLWDNSGIGGVRAFGGGKIYISGMNTAQSSLSNLFVGQVHDDGATGRHIQGQHRGSGLESAAGSTGIYFFDGGASSSDAADGKDFFGATPDHVVLESSFNVGASADGTASRGSRVFAADSTSGAPNASTTYYANSVAHSVDAGTVGTVRTGIAYDGGFVGGLLFRRVVGGEGPSVNIFDLTDDKSSASPTSVTMSGNATTNMFSAEMSLLSNAVTYSLKLGDSGVTGRGAFIDDDHFLAIESSQASSLQNGGVIETDFVNLAMASSAFIEHDSFLPAGTSFCDCRFSQWGALMAYADIKDSSSTHEVPLAFWVAGELSNAAQFGGAVQDATYSGHIIGTVHRAGQVYAAAGSMELQFEIGGGTVRMKDVTVTNFDQTNFTKTSGTTGGPFAGNFYNNLLEGGAGRIVVRGTHPTAGLLDMRIHGAFFGTGTPPEETAGRALVKDVGTGGADYRAGAIYQAKKQVGGM